MGRAAERLPGRRAPQGMQATSDRPASWARPPYVSYLGGCDVSGTLQDFSVGVFRDAARQHSDPFLSPRSTEYAWFPEP